MTTQREHLAANLIEARNHLDRTLIEINKGLTRLEGASAKDHGMTCLDCGVTFRSVTRLAEHAYTSHDAPDPAHWIEAEARTDA